LRIGASDCRRPLTATLALLVDDVVDGGAAETLPAAPLIAPTAML